MFILVLLFIILQLIPWILLVNVVRLSHETFKDLENYINDLVQNAHDLPKDDPRKERLLGYDEALGDIMNFINKRKKI